jgi:Zn-dependent M28 family amino/carboxypeptidase
VNLSRFGRIVSLGVVLAACSSGAGESSNGSPVTVSVTQAAPATVLTTTVAPSTTPPTSPPIAAVSSTTVAPQTLSVREIVTALASDEFAGRDNDTVGSQLSQRLLIDELSSFAQPAFPDKSGDERFLQPIPGGNNILAVIPGGDLADQWVIIGGHYDHLGNADDCARKTADDSICNGATDNAAGVAETVAVARSIAADGVPRRSVLIAIWDREEDYDPALDLGLIGSNTYLQAPVAPLDKTTVYLNFDVQGATLLPTLATTTVVVGAETGGQALIDATTAAVKASSLNSLQLSLLFGQGRSDHAVFANAKIPTVFFTDANTACYHTVKDDLGAVDFAKLDQQIANATALATTLIATDTPPVFDSTAPASKYEDAVSMLAVTTTAQTDFGLLSPDAASFADSYVAQLQAIVDAGPEKFDDQAIGDLLGGAVQFVDALTKATCQP